MDALISLGDVTKRYAAGGEPAVMVRGSEVTVVAPDRPGLLWRAAGVLASHRLVVRSANATSVGVTAVSVFDVEPEFGDPPDATLVAADLRRTIVHSVLAALSD